MKKVLCTALGMLLLVAANGFFVYHAQRSYDTGNLIAVTPGESIEFFMNSPEDSHVDIHQLREGEVVEEVGGRFRTCWDGLDGKRVCGPWFVAKRKSVAMGAAH